MIHNLNDATIRIRSFLTCKYSLVIRDLIQSQVLSSYEVKLVLQRTVTRTHQVVVLGPGEIANSLVLSYAIGN